MTDAAYKAQEWLEHLNDLYYDAEKTRKAIMLLESKINNAVRSYDASGRGASDLIVRQQQHEDALLTYSEKQTEYDRKYYQFVRQEIIALKLFSCMRNGFHAGLLMNRYFNRMKWTEIEKLHKDRCKKSSLRRHFRLALDEFAPLIETSEPQAIQEAERDIKETLIKIKHQKSA